MVNGWGDGKQVLVQTNVFRPDCVWGHVMTKPMQKTFRTVYDKSLLDDRLDCYPFGYKGPYFNYDV